jgi:hypothetical protein
MASNGNDSGALQCKQIFDGLSEQQRNAMAEVRELMEEVRNGMKDVRPEVAEECAQQIRASEGELARIGARLSGAMPASAITPTRVSAAPADSAGGMFWLPRQTTSQLHSNIDRLSSQPLTPTNFQFPIPDPYPVSGGCRGLWRYHEPEPTIRDTHLK